MQNLYKTEREAISGKKNQLGKIIERFCTEFSPEQFEEEYQGETLGNLQSVLEVRVGSLLKREIGNVYNVRESILKPEQWLDVPAIIELESLGEGPANFGILVTPRS